MAVDDVLEELMGNLGEFGFYQGSQFVLHVLSAITAGIHMLSLVTISAVPEHRCFIEGLDNSSTYNALPWNSSEILAAIPLKENGVLDSCHMYDDNRSVVPCEAYVYDHTYYEDTRSIDWQHVCDRRWMGSIVQTVFMWGALPGSILLGGLADRIGRRPVFCWSALMQLIIALTVAFTEQYAAFIVARFFLGVFTLAGTFVSGFVLTMELVGQSKRTSLGIAFQAVFSVGVMLVPGWCSIIKTRKLLQITYALHGLLLLPHWWLLDESPRWLWIQGRFSEAIEIVAKGMRLNGMKSKLDREYFLKKPQLEMPIEEEQQRVSLSALFKAKNMRARTLNLCFCYVANSLVYYGLSLNTANLQGHKLVIIFLMAAIELPSYATVAYIVDIMGRRSITSAFLAAGGVSCIAASIYYGTSIATGLAILGKLFVAGSFSVIYNYSAELLPTVVRNSAMSLCAMCASIGGSLTPLISLLDAFDPRLPALVFGGIAVLSGCWVMFLPETMNQRMPESIEDGENFGLGDTCFSRRKRNEERNADEEYRVPLKAVAADETVKSH